MFGLLRRKLSDVLRVLNDYLLRGALPGWITVFIRDLMKFRNRSEPSISQLGEHSSNKRVNTQ